MATYLPIPSGASTASSAFGRFEANPWEPYGPLGSSTRVVPASYFVPRGNRLFGFTVEIDMGNLMSLGVRWESMLRERLVHRMGEAADVIIMRAHGKLVPGHGYDTGTMAESLRRVLVHGIEQNIVAYDLEADPYEAYYWVFVEFGHMTVGGNWWPGYYFLSSTLMENEALIAAKAKQAMAETVTMLAMTKQLPAGF
jgi:hypothetical protein